MLRYNLLFVHVVAAMGLFTALGMEAVVLMQLRRASDSSAALAALATFASSQRVAGLSMLGLLLSGLYLATRYWQWQGAWIGLGFAGFLLVGATGGLMSGRILGQVRKQLREGEVEASLMRALPTLRQSLLIRAALLVGVVYLMTVKPWGAIG